MRAFADYLETTAAAAATTAARNVTTQTAVKLACKITDTASDSLIDERIVKVSKMIADYCRLAKDGAGSPPTFSRETLRATWHPQSDCDGHSVRGVDLFLPWRLPVFSIDSVVEAGTSLTAGTHFLLMSSMPGRLRRMSADTPVDWSTGKIVVVFKAGFSATASLAANIDPVIEVAAIEQIKAMLFGANRDPNLKSEATTDVGSASYSVPGGDALADNMLLPNVGTMLAQWRKPTP